MAVVAGMEVPVVVEKEVEGVDVVLDGLGFGIVGGGALGGGRPNRRSAPLPGPARGAFLGTLVNGVGIIGSGFVDAMVSGRVKCC